MTIEAELERLVEVYATFDSEHNCYVGKKEKLNLLSLESDFVKLVNQQLLEHGPSKEAITSQYRKISVKFHPDRKSTYSPEISWLEHNLSEGRNDGACFKVLNFCNDKFINPEQFKDSKFADIKTKEDCKKWLDGLKNQANTYTGRSLYDSLQDLLDQSSNFFDDAGKIKPTGLRVLIKSIPVIFSTYGTFIFAEELFAVYALYFIMLKSGQYLETCKSSELKSIGKTLQEISTITATATTTFMVRLLEMIFWASHQCLDVSLQIGSSILTPLLPVPSSSQESMPEEDSSKCMDLILASQNMQEGMQFRTPELKVISAPLESYLGLNAQQFFRGFRLGQEKFHAIEAFLFRMRVLDNSPGSIESKLTQAEDELRKIKDNPKVYNSTTAAAVDRARRIIDLLTESDVSDRQLVVYTPR
ncbi:J domain-containing protein [Legionella bononiensis]|uniref:J domain-containing protein n=1 Tax=Legionella bononiensis TaxID=2793102 RepID=A0ABS1W8F2_9GAMM|nr:J domain-containing protein [Legionella bononiensis]MBL7479842.1 J domain-containing protein [Legionella bononiensis]MBL7525643.1 J domain-containing protein [Legionella bononiensis]MBL7561826.1 J domain-containing protein [Legionella bononiensis]